MKKILLIFGFILISLFSVGQTWTIKEVHEAQDSLVKVCVTDTERNVDSIIYIPVDSLNIDNEYNDFAIMCMNYIDDGETITNAVYLIKHPEYLISERLLVLTDVKGYIVNTLEYDINIKVKLTSEDYIIFRKLYDLVNIKINI
jgi:hypothetical protein